MRFWGSRNSFRLGEPVPRRMPGLPDTISLPSHRGRPPVIQIWVSKPPAVVIFCFCVSVGQKHLPWREKYDHSYSWNCGNSDLNHRAPTLEPDGAPSCGQKFLLWRPAQEPAICLRPWQRQLWSKIPPLAANTRASHLSATINLYSGACSVCTGPSSWLCKINHKPMVLDSRRMKKCKMW